MNSPQVNSQQARKVFEQIMNTIEAHDQSKINDFIKVLTDYHASLGFTPVSMEENHDESSSNTNDESSTENDEDVENVDTPDRRSTRPRAASDPSDVRVLSRMVSGMVPVAVPPELVTTVGNVNVADVGSFYNVWHQINSYQFQHQICVNLAFYAKGMLSEKLKGIATGTFKSFVLESGFDLKFYVEMCNATRYYRICQNFPGVLLTNKAPMQLIKNWNKVYLAKLLTGDPELVEPLFLALRYSKVRNAGFVYEPEPIPLIDWRRIENNREVSE